MLEQPDVRPTSRLSRAHPGTEGSHDVRTDATRRHAVRAGTEPRSARSPLRLRLLLSGIFLPVFLVAAVLFGVWAGAARPGDMPGRGGLVGVAVVCTVLALTAAIDVVVVSQRQRRERDAAHAQEPTARPTDQRDDG
ncbi:DUF6343 family protein [Streptomyces populi]